MKQRLTWRGRDGRQLGVIGEPAMWALPRLSPDGRRVAMYRVDDTLMDLWLLDVDRNVTTRFSSGPGYYRTPVWSPDGKWIAYFHNAGGRTSIRRKDAGGERQEDVLAETGSERGIFIWDWSSDGKYLVHSIEGRTGPLYLRPVAGGEPAKLFLDGKLRATAAVISPDANWVAYQAEESGRAEIYAERFAALGNKVRLSVNGGRLPRWRRDGEELFFISGENRLTSVEIRSSGIGPELGKPVELFPTPPSTLGYDVTADGQRFLVLEPSAGEGQPLTVLTNWQEQLQ